jgi:hypothetical protein
MGVHIKYIRWILFWSMSIHSNSYFTVSSNFFFDFFSKMAHRTKLIHNIKDRSSEGPLTYLKHFRSAARIKKCNAQITLQSEMYDSVFKSFRTGRLERELQMVQLFATRCSCIAILWISLLSFAAITLCVASQRVFVVVVVVVYFVIDSVRKLYDTPPYMTLH